MTFKEGLEKLRSFYPDAAITVKAIQLDATQCVSEATITVDCKVLSTASAIRFKKESDKNDKYVSDCEEAAILRAIKYIHIPESRTVAAEPSEAELKMKVMKYIERHHMSTENQKKICQLYEIENIQDMTAEQCKHYILTLKNRGGNIDE